MPTRIQVLMLILLLPISGALGQEAAALADRQARIYELLTYQCGADDVEDRFRLEISKLGRDVQPLLVSVLRDGLPAEVRARAEEQALERYQRRQAWLRENGEALFGEETERLSARTSEEYVADAIRRLDILFRENAIRGLGEIGDDAARREIEAAVERYPDLRGLAESALRDIARRD